MARVLASAGLISRVPAPRDAARLQNEFGCRLQFSNSRRNRLKTTPYTPVELRKDNAIVTSRIAVNSIEITFSSNHSTMSELSSPPAHQLTPALSPTQTQDAPNSTNLVLIDPNAEIVPFDYEGQIRADFERGLQEDEVELNRAFFTRLGGEESGIDEISLSVAQKFCRNWTRFDQSSSFGPTRILERSIRINSTNSNQQLRKSNSRRRISVSLPPCSRAIRAYRGKLSDAVIVIAQTRSSVQHFLDSVKSAAFQLFGTSTGPGATQEANQS